MTVRQKHSAFSLVELLVVIAIIAALAGISTATLTAMKGVSSLDNAASKTRSLMHQVRNILPQVRRDDLSESSPRIRGADYSGVGLVFHESEYSYGDIEILPVNNNQMLRQASGVYFESAELEAYQTLVSIEPAWLSSDLTVVGLGVASDSPLETELIVLAPPFAVCFDAEGTSIPPVRSSQTVFCDLNDDGMIDEASDEGDIHVAISGLLIVRKDSIPADWELTRDPLTGAYPQSVTEWLEETENRSIMLTIRNSIPLIYP